jgi:hypothetical protein
VKVRHGSLTLLAAAAFVLFLGPLEGSARADASECVKSSEEGLLARDKGRLRDARQRFVTCAADACPKPLRIDCARWLEDVESSLPTVVFGARDAKGEDLFDVDVFVDGERVVGHEQGKAVALDPGPHVVRFERAKTGKTTELKVLLRAGEHNRSILATLATAEERATPRSDGISSSSKPSSSSVSIPAVVLGGVGILALGSFGFFALEGSGEKDRLATSCSPRCTDAQVSDLRTDYLVADVSLGVGVVALGLAALFWFTHDPDRRADAAPPQVGRFARTIWK